LDPYVFPAIIQLRNYKEVRKMKTTKKLSLDELERVSGGINLGGWTPVAPDDFGLTFGGELMNAQACREVLGGIYDTFGEDYAIEYAKKNIVQTSDWLNYTRQGGIYFAVDMIYGKLYLSHITGESAY
jgi:hypothetical protein